jgi:hypothetical protein
MHSPERILEALAWLYGGEVRNNGEAMAAWPYRRREDITNTLARAAYLTWMRGRLALRGLEK